MPFYKTAPCSLVPLKDMKNERGGGDICILVRECKINDLCMKMHIYVRCKCKAAKSYPDTSWIHECWWTWGYSVCYSVCMLGFNCGSSVILIDGFWSLYWLVRCDKVMKWTPGDTEVRSWRPALMTFWLSLSHQHPLTGTFLWWRAYMVHEGRVRECQREDQTLCVCFCVCLRVCV